MTNRKRTNYTNMSKYNKYISGDPRTAHLTWQPGDSVQFYLGLMADLTLYFIRASGGSNYNEIINIEDFQEDYLEAQEQYPGSEIILKTGVTRKPITYRQAEQYVIDTLATTENILHNYQKLTNQTREEAKQDFERLNYSAVYINKLGHMDTQEMLDALLGKPRIPAWLERKLTKTTLAEAHKHTNGQNVEVFRRGQWRNLMENTVIQESRQLKESLSNDDYYFNIWVRNHEQGEVDNFLEVIPSLENGTFEEDFALAAGSEGFLIYDWEMVLDYNLGTYAGEIEIEAIGNLILEAKKQGAHLLLVAQAYLDRGEQPQDIDLNGDYHVLENEENTISLDSALGYTWENHIGLDYTDKENYFDYEAFGRDIRISGDLDAFIADHLLYDEEILDGKDGWDVVSEENIDIIVDDYLRERVHDLFTMSDYALGVDFTDGFDPRELPNNYFDYEAFGRDLGFDYDYVTVDVHGHLALDGWVRID